MGQSYKPAVTIELEGLTWGQIFCICLGSNWERLTTEFPFTLIYRLLPMQKTLAKWPISSFNYLGIRIWVSIKDSYKLKQFWHLLSDQDRWFDLGISWMGRISLIKNNLMPRISYPMLLMPIRSNKAKLLFVLFDMLYQRQYKLVLELWPISRCI